MSEQEIETIVNKIGEVAPDQVAKFLANPEGFDYSVLEGYTDFTDKYRNVADFLGDKAGIKATIWKDLDGKFPSKARFNSLQEKYPWLSEEELKEWFDKTNEYKKFYEDEARKEGEKNLRKKEVKDLPWYEDLIASDYSKQRYIDDPNASIIGKQGKFNPLSTQGAEELMDVGLGVAGSIGDAIPGVGSVFLGPAARTTRDVAHKLYESPYQKDWNQIRFDTGKDIGLNAAAWLLPNMRKTAKAADMFADPEVVRVMQIAEETKNIQNGARSVAKHYGIPSQEIIDKYRDIGKAYPHNDIALTKAIDNMPASELKTELQKIVSSTPPNKPLNRAKIQEVTNNYVNQTNKFAQNIQKYNQEIMAPTGAQDYGVKTMNIGGKPVDVVIDPKTSKMAADLAGSNSTYMANALKAKSYDELSKMQKLKYRGNQIAHALNSGYPGQVVMQEMYTGVGRGKSPTVVETAIRKKELEDRINNVISTYSLLWSKTKKPLGYESNPIIKEAWEKWRNQ
jgi:hypothetical protein